jgi:3-methyladenine DNA glycosylase/8-oxoguanine DNA glycosylase
VHRLVESHHPVDLSLTLGLLSRGGRDDPCVRITPGKVWRATRLGSGPATTCLSSIDPHRIDVRAWGPGAEEALTLAPALVGADDDDGGLAASAEPLVRDLARRFAGLRIGRSSHVLEALVPTILEQKVQGKTARRAFSAMVRAAASPAPAADDPGGPHLLLPPTAEWLARCPSWSWHRWGVEEKRASTVRVAASYAHRLATLPSLPPADAASRLRALPGVGAWSAAEVVMVALGDPDAVSVGDYWLPHWVCNALAGEPRGTDERMAELLAPWAGQRGRLCRLIQLGGPPPPRYGPRLPLHRFGDS